MTTAPLPRRYRFAVAGRMLAAVVGGYAVAVLLSIACAFALPMAKAEAVVTGMLAAILAWPFTAMAVVWARSALRAWGGVALACALLAGIAAANGWRP